MALSPPRLLPLAITTLCLVFSASNAGAQSWTNVGGPPNYSAQLSGSYGATSPATPGIMYIASGFSHVWSVPLGCGAQLQWNALPTTGLGPPWLIDRMVVNKPDAPVLAVTNIQSPQQNNLMYFDAANAVWKQSQINNPLFLNPPRIAVARNWDILASYANAVLPPPTGAPASCCATR